METIPAGSLTKKLKRGPSADHPPLSMKFRCKAALIVILSPLAQAADRTGDAWTDARNPVRVLFKGERLDLWSLRPAAVPQVPEVRRTDWPRQALDRFILAKLEASGLSPAPAADRRALGRRLGFDLTGLPLSPEELDAFVNDAAAGAEERLVDRLLATRAFAEHWARWRLPHPGLQQPDARTIKEILGTATADRRAEQSRIDGRLIVYLMVESSR